MFAGAGLCLVAVGVPLGAMSTLSARVLHTRRHAAAGHGTTLPVMEKCQTSVTRGPVAGLPPRSLARRWSQGGPLAGLGCSPLQPRPLALRGR